MARTTGIDRLASIVRRAETGRTGATPEGARRNWQASERAAAAAFAAGLREVVALEDAAGVEAAVRKADRLTALRQRAQRCGLLSPGDVITIERKVTS
jgi:hypothetical protein